MRDAGGGAGVRDPTAAAGRAGGGGRAGHADAAARRRPDRVPEAAEAVDPGLARDLAAYGGGRLLAGPSLYEDVVMICGTNTTWRQAVVTINRIAALGDGGALPEPAAVLRAGEDWLRAEARVGYRGGAILAAARSAIDGTLAEIEAARPPATASARTRSSRARRGGAGDGRVPGAADGALRPPGRRLGDGPAGAGLVRRAPPDAAVLARVAPAGRFSGLVLAWSTLRAWQRETGIVPA